MSVVTGVAALERRILDAGVRCIERWGLSKTTLDDVAREAGCSRATIYRAFPGGREALLRRLLDRETTSFFGELDEVLGRATTLQELVETGVVEAILKIARHPVLHAVVQYEDGTLLSWRSNGLGAAHATASAWAASHLRRFLAPGDAEATADWLVRAVLAALQCDSPTLDAGRPETVRRTVQRFVLPGVLGAGEGVGLPR